jgi:DNA-binding NarL/FixJ family response regulator
MRNRRHPRHVLADLIESHYGQQVEPARARKRSRRGPELLFDDWKVVEEISVGPNRYVLLSRNQVASDGFESLTPRELDAVRHACAGSSNKEIAYLMGITASTVGVLLWRASRKLGAGDREALIRTFTTSSMR